MANAPAANSPSENRPYHHGDLSRALIEAARAIVERDGPQALSLRAVAREAGVSPAAPYHHFKDKLELMLAVGKQGFEMLGQAMAAAMDAAGADVQERVAAIGVSYVLFARAHPSLYRVMYDCTRQMESLPEDMHEKEDSAYSMVREALVAAGRAAPDDPIGIELATVAAWCAAHGVAEMSSFAQFKPLCDALGGEENFLRELIRRVGAYMPR